jgi:uncharacterized RDD family membrane protein YckC
VAITVLKNNAPWGPFSREQVEAGIQRGDFTLKYLAHTPGLHEWLPLGEVLHYLESGPALPPLPERDELPPVPTRPPVHAPTFPTPAASPATPPPFAAPIVATPVQVPASVHVEPHLQPASFFARSVAFLFDCAILFLPVVLLFALNAIWVSIKGWWTKAPAEEMHQQWALWSRDFHHLLWLVAIGLAWLYAAGLESSRWQATIGKRWLNLRVTDSHGERLGFLQATGRHFAKYLSGVIFFLGFIAALFSSRGLALHDRLARTRVIRNR